MKLVGMSPTGRSLMAIAIVAGLGVGCESDKKDKRDRTPVTPAVACSEGFKDGESQELTLYRKEIAPYGTSCTELAFTAKAVCAAGVTNLSEAGSKTCEETVFSTISLSSDANQFEVGQPFSLKLEGVNQLNEKIIVDASQATWTSSSSKVTISKSGVITGTAIANDVTITATVGNLKAEYKLTIVGKSCDQTPDGGSREFDLYVKATIPYNGTCEAEKVKLTCSNGAFSIPADKSETCTKATLTGLTAEPASVALIAGESREIKLFLTDSIGTKVSVPANEATWTIPAGAKVSVENGLVKASERIEQKFEISIAASGFTTTLTVGPQARLEGFEEKDVLMKSGDELTLNVKADRPVEAKELNWESSDPELVSVELGKIKALKANGTATITAKLDKQTIQTKVTVEAALTITKEAVRYDDSQILNNGELAVKDVTFEMPKFIAYQFIVSGPAQEKTPVLVTPTEGCGFTLAAAQKKWDLQVALDETRDVLPAKCEVEVQVSSKAGQKVSEKIKITVDYNKIVFTELPQVVGNSGRELARVDYKFSSGISVPEVTVIAVREDVYGVSDCQFAVIPEASSYLIVSTNPNAVGCVGLFKMSLLDSNFPDWKGDWTDLVVISNEKSLAEICTEAAAGSEQEKTVLALAKSSGFVLSRGRNESVCRSLGRDLRKANLSQLETMMAYDNRGGSQLPSPYSLRLAQKDLSDLSPLARLVAVEELDLSGNDKIANIDALKNLKALRHLGLKRTAVTDFSPIFNHPVMTSLSLPQADTKIACAANITNPKIKELCP